MDLERLLRERLIEKVTADKAMALSLLEAAAKDLKTAEDNVGIGHFEWGLAIAYNGMLNAGRALMAAKGYRAFSESHHLAVVQFCAAVLPEDASGLVSTFNRLRMRRHDVVYGEIAKDSVGEEEAKRALQKAKLFIEEIRKLQFGKT